MCTKLHHVHTPIRISRALMTNTLCSAIGAFLAYDLAVIWRYRAVIARAWQDLWQLIDMGSR